jgi:hypothetical protein
VERPALAFALAGGSEAAAPQAMNRVAFAAIALATLLGAWLRLHGLDVQVVQDDEWHAIHKLMTASYGEIARSFGVADHSIPLTLFYKAMAETAGLDEVNMRIVQAICGIALIAVGGWLAFRATANAATAALFAFLLAGAPFLVLYSRFARPYAITTLLSVLVLAALWRWRSTRSARLAAAICLMASLAAWLHPLAALYPMAALLFILLDDLQSSRWRIPAARSTILLGVVAGLAIAAPLIPPILGDLQSLSAKAGDSRPTPYTLSRVISLFAGGLPDAVTVLVAAIAAWGAAIRIRQGSRVDRYLLFTVLAPLLAVIVLRGSWTHQGHTLARYVLPAQVAFLFWVAAGAMDIAGRLALGRTVAAQGLAAAILAAGYLALNPAIHQVRTLGPWYGHLYHHFDYVPEDNRALRYYDNWRVPDFYRKLGTMPEGSVTIIEAPFDFAAPYNPDAFYAQFHHQRELQGFVHDLCMPGRFYGEVPKDPRFRFRSFVYLDDRDAVKRSGARYLVLQRDLRNGEPFKEADRCLEALRQRYGEPIEADPRVAVFDLGAR